MKQTDKWTDNFKQGKYHENRNKQMGLNVSSGGVGVTLDWSSRKACERDGS